MQSCELVTLVSSLSCCIAKGKTSEEITLLSSLFLLLGQNLDTIAASGEFCKSKRKEECECERESECESKSECEKERESKNECEKESESKSNS